VGSPPPTATEEKPRDAETAPTPGASTGAEETTKAQPKTAQPQPSEQRKPPPAEPPPEPERDEDVAGRHEAKAPRVTKAWAWAFDAAGTFGSGITLSHSRIGGLVRVNCAFSGPFVTASVGYAVERPLFTGLSVDWIQPSLGAGYVFQLGSVFTAEVRAEVVAELLHGHAGDPETGDESTAYRWLGGGRLGLAAAWAPFDAVSLLAGGAVSARGPETDILMRNLVQVSTSILAYQAEAGLRFTVR
jgi:hypothetical protein